MKVKEEFIFKGFKCDGCGKKIKCTNIYHLTPAETSCGNGCDAKLIADVESIYRPVDATDFSVAFTFDQMKEAFNQCKFSSVFPHYNMT